MPECPYPPLLLLDLSQSENNYIKRQFKAGFYLMFRNVFKIVKQVIKVQWIRGQDVSSN